MGENKYFIPKIEDIFIGYEFETLLNLELGSSLQNGWNKYTIDLENNIDDLFIEIVDTIKKKNIRTPYLTKEQIESEGWLFADIKNSDDTIFLSFYKIIDDHIQLKLIYDINNIDFETGDIIENVRKLNIEKILFKNNEKFVGTYLIQGIECKCINQFRLITKLLNIK